MSLVLLGGVLELREVEDLLKQVLGALETWLWFLTGHLHAALSDGVEIESMLQ